MPLLGVSIAGSELPILGPAAILVICLWFYFCLRRENHLIGDLLTDAHANKSADAQTIRAFVFQGIVLNSVFITMTQDDGVRHSLKDKHESSFGSKFLHWLLWLLYFVPFISVGWVLSCDIVSYFQEPLFRPVSLDHQLSSVVGEIEFNISLALYIIPLFCGSVVLMLCYKNAKFVAGTKSIIKEFSETHITTSAKAMKTE